MRYFILVCIFMSMFYLCSQGVSAESRTVVTQKPYYYPNNYREPYFSDLGALEKYVFNRTYPRENIITRIQRLENEAFGAVQSGDMYLRYDRVKSAVLSRPKNDGKMSLLRTIGNYFAGQMTGYTPPIDNSIYSPYNYTPNVFSQNLPQAFSQTPYPTTYDNGRMIEYGSPFNHGYRLNNFGTGSSSGVHILN